MNSGRWWGGQVPWDANRESERRVSMREPACHSGPRLACYVSVLPKGPGQQFPLVFSFEAGCLVLRPRPARLRPQQCCRGPAGPRGLGLDRQRGPQRAPGHAPCQLDVRACAGHRLLSLAFGELSLL